MKLKTALVCFVCLKKLGKSSSKRTIWYWIYFDLRNLCKSFEKQSLWNSIRDGHWPDRRILLTCSQKEANPSLTRILFDPTWWDFLWLQGKKLKIWDSKGKFSKPKPKMADRPEQHKIDPTQPRSKIYYPGPITKPN